MCGESELMIKLFLFDWGDVCGSYDVERFDGFLRQNGYDTKGLKQFFSQKKPDFDRGLMTESQFWNALKKEIGFDGPWQTLATNNQKNLVLNQRLLKFIKTLRQRFSVAILSNMDPTSIRQIRREIQLEDYFDKAYFSCELGRGKLEDGVVRRILSDFDVTADQVVFVDDFTGNIEKGRILGFHCIHYHNFDDFKRQLQGLLSIRTA